MQANMCVCTQAQSEYAAALKAVSELLGDNATLFLMLEEAGGSTVHCIACRATCLVACGTAYGERRAR